MIFDRYQSPATNPIPWGPALPPSLPWTPDAFEELKKIIERLDALDKKLGLEHCEDPKKGAWMKAVEKRLLGLEKKKPRKTVVAT